MSHEGGVGGIWISRVPFLESDGAAGQTCIELSFAGTLDQLADHAIVEDSALDPETGEWVSIVPVPAPYEWIVPPDVVNSATRRLLTDDEAWDLRHAETRPA